MAELLADGRSVEEVADARGEPVAATEKAVARIREKTDRALATLLESPFVEEAAADLSEDGRERLIELLDAE